MIKFYPLLIFLLPFLCSSQIYRGDPERFPKFAECENVDFEQEEQCFSRILKSKVLEEFELPPVIMEENYEGEIVVLFEVTREGKFQTVYVDAAYPEWKDPEINSG